MLINFRQILIWQRNVDEQIGLKLADQRHRFRDVVGIHPGCFKFGSPVSCVDGISDGITFRFGTGSEHDFTKHLAVLCTFVSDNAAHAACSDDENF